MGKRVIALSVAALAVALVVLGCGGDSASISRAEFVKKAEAVCKKGEENLRKSFTSYVEGHKNVTKPSEAQLAALVDAVFSGNIEAEVKQLRAIGLPSGGEEQVEALLDAREESVKGAEAEPREAISDGEKVFGKASKLAKAYGLKACSER
jgi:hypothetical protein